MLYNDNVVRSPNFGPLFAAPLFSCIASHQARGLRNHRDGTQATTEGSEILATELIVACTAYGGRLLSQRPHGAQANPEVALCLC